MATAAAAVVARARREVEEMFWKHDAFGPDRAFEFQPRMFVQERYLEQLIAEGIVHQTTPGHYWLDRRAFEDNQRQRMKWSMRILALSAVVVAIVFAVQLVMRLR